MNDFDDRIRNALQAEHATEDGAFERIGQAFLKRSRALMIIGWIKMGFFVIIAAFAAYRYYQSPDPKAMLGWAAVFIVMSLSLGIGFIIYWLELIRISVLREIKRLELRLIQTISERRG
ncbi:MAG: hypothetical protein JNK58_07770 [Phycisphaerae bacterium]|nr:hypothetical protein [Phycisphaerae bacterium]